jgi:hypothetical protein
MPRIIDLEAIPAAHSKGGNNTYGNNTHVSVTTTGSVVPSNNTKDLMRFGLQAILTGQTEVKLPPKDVDFARSLFDALERYRGLTEKQAFWARKLIARSRGEEETKSRPTEELGGDLAPVVAMFDAAKKSGLKHPRLSIVSDGLPDLGADVTISLAGSASTVPGSINVTDGKPYGSNVWYGRIIERQGGSGKSYAFEASPRILPGTKAEVLKTLMALAADPLGIVTRSGKKSGFCACCNRKLDDPKSVEAGVGPVCAKKWGIAR